MSLAESYRKLDLKPGVSEREVKTAFRKLALKYHPDLNNTKDSKRKFQEIKEAYESIMDSDGKLIDEEYRWRDAEEVIRAEREKVKQRVRAREEKKRKERERFEKSEWHDILLFVKYLLNGLAILLSILAVVVPVILALLIEPAILLATIYFIVIGTVMLIYIYNRRKSWFRLGRFNMKWKDISGLLRMPESRSSNDRCCYTQSRVADGKSYSVELLKTVDISVRHYGILNHSAKYKNKIKRIIIPRSIKAQFWHRMSSMIKITSIIFSMVFIPVDSLFWRFIMGIFAGGILSVIFLGLAGVKSKVSYLLTPGLIIKSIIWLLVLYKISIVGPGFNIQFTTSIYVAIAGLIFLLDMLFDLIMGLFPFYSKLFIPIIRQGKLLNALYKDGYQNNQEFPVYSVLFPLYKWLF